MPDVNVKWIVEWYDSPNEVPQDVLGQFRGSHGLETVPIPVMSLDDLEAWLTGRMHVQQVARLREALQTLYDEQNDAPLEHRRTQWTDAMRVASDALRETGASPFC